MWYDAAAHTEETEMKIVVGGPESYLPDALIQAGIAPDVSGSAELAERFYVPDGIIILDDASSFMPSRGAIRLDHDGGSDWFTYEAMGGDVLFNVKRLSGTKIDFPAGTVAGQWRDITEYVSDSDTIGALRGQIGEWSTRLTGSMWGSLVQFDGASLLCLVRARNSTYVDMDAPVGLNEESANWTPWMLDFRGVFGPVSVEADDLYGADWTVTAYGLGLRLRQQQVTTGYYGSEVAQGTYSATSEVTDPAQLVWLGNRVAPLTAEKAGDNDRNTGWASTGSPRFGTPLPVRPSGNVQGSPPLADFVRGYGLKVQEVFPNGFDSLASTGQEGMWILLYNPQRDELPDLPVGAGATPPDPRTVGQIDVGGYRFYNRAGYWFAPGLRNGYRSEIWIKPGTGMILCFDREVFLRRFPNLPDDWEIVEFRHCDGWYPGVPANVAARGGASRFTLDGLADAFGIRAGDGYWIDYTAWGPWTPPAEFWVTDGDRPIYDQNADGRPAHRVWGNRANVDDMYLYGPGATVSPTLGIPRGYSIRRWKCMGGGTWMDNGEDDYGPGGGSFFNHDSGTATDWELRAYPRIDNRGPLESTEALFFDVAEFAPTEVITDNTEVDGTITVEPGTAPNYMLQPGERVWASGGQVEFTFERFDYDSFYGVVKTKGAGISCEGQTLKIWTNTNADTSAPVGRWELTTLPLLSVIDVATWYNPPSATVVEDTYATNGQVRVQPGDASRFPASGSFTQAPLDQSEIRTPQEYTYTSHDESVFYGVTVPGNAARRPTRPGGTINSTRTAVYPSRYRLIGTRVKNPSDYLAFIGDNPDWQILQPTGGAEANQKGFLSSVTLGEGSRRFRRLAFVVEEMSDGGPAYVTEFTPWKYPVRIFDSAHTAAVASALPYTITSVIEDVLIAAGIPEHQRDIRHGGPPIRGERISQGSVYEALEMLSNKGGILTVLGPDYCVHARLDPRAAGRAWTLRPPMELNPDTISDFRAEPQPRLEVGQVELTGYNELTAQRWTVVYPSAPSRFGRIRPLPDVPAFSLADTYRQARLAFNRLNQEVRFSMSIGQQSDIQLGDVLPLDAVVDQFGRKWTNTDVFITDIKRRTDHEGREGDLAGQQFRST